MRCQLLDRAVGHVEPLFRCHPAPVDLAALEVVARVADHLEEDIVRFDERAGPSGHGDSVDPGITQTLVAKLGLAAGLLGDVVRAPRLALTHLALDRGQQPAQLVFGDVVVRAGSHRRHCVLLAHRTGHDDEGKITRQLPDHRERCRGAEPRHRPVADHHIPLGAENGSTQRRLRLHAFVLDEQAAALEHPEEELGVALGVFDEQYTQFRAHAWLAWAPGKVK